MKLSEELKKIVKGEVFDDAKTLDAYSRDASLLQVRPSVVVAPKDVEDIKNLVKFVSSSNNLPAGRQGSEHPLSLTVRAGGTDMTGGPLGESIILDMTKHFSGTLEVRSEKLEATVLPGTYYRDFEKETLKHGLILPSYPASREICTVGGMVSNNSGGEKTLKYGKTEDYITELNVVLSDGNEYTIKSKPAPETEFEKKILELIKNNQEIIKKAKPDVSKNSAGYYLWNVLSQGPTFGNTKGRSFDLTKLICGAQGTLGIVTKIKFKLVPVKKYSKLLVIFLHKLDVLADLTATILPFAPESLEVYDDNTLKLAFKFWRELSRVVKPKHAFKLLISLLPELWEIIWRGLPKITVMAEIAGDDEALVDKTLRFMNLEVKSKFKLETHITHSQDEVREYWAVRRESFNLLRRHAHNLRTAPFIDDIIVKPKYLPEFLPKLEKILNDYKLIFTIAGHDGDGNLHIIPLMNLKDKNNIQLIRELSDKVYDLVVSYHGSITAEHNDGIIRTPYLPKMFSPEVIKLFEETKRIFDPLNIFNPHKKVGGTFEYIEQHIATN